MRCTAALLVLLAASSGLAQRDARFFNDPQFWDGFQTGMGNVGDQIRRRIGSNLETTIDHLDNFGKSVGQFSRTIEDQVQDSLPDWLRGDPSSRSPEDAPIEAVEGSLGMDGLDDGLQVYFEGDSNGEELPEPHIIPGPNLFQEGAIEEAAEEAVPPPRTGGPLFDLRFDIPNRFPSFGNYPRFPFDTFFRRPAQPWWKGENVCVEEEEIDEAEGVATIDVTAEQSETELLERTDTADGGRGLFFFGGEMSVKSCSDMIDKYTCVTRTRGRGINRTVRQSYKCCHGYIREENQGCTQVNMVPLDESLEILGLTDFLTLADNAGVRDLLQTNNLTIFAPTNEAVEDFTTDLTENNDIDLAGNEVFRRKRQTDGMSPKIQEIVFSHMYDGFLYGADMKDEQVIKSMASDSSIRINIYQDSPPVMTANCAKITKVNQHSTNGIIHTVERVMQPATKSIADIIGSDPQFTILKKLISDSDMLTQLRDAGQMTLLAPTDAAFSTLPEGELLRLMEVSACLPSVLKNHILPNVICSAAITSAEAKTLNLLHKFLIVEQQTSGKLFVEDAQIVAKDIMATNGVIHIIDKPLLPTEAKPVLELLEQRNLTRFLELVELAELKNEINGLRDATVFVPSNEAFDAIDDSYLEELKNDRQGLRDVLQHHILNAPFSSADIVNNHQIDTTAGTKMRFNLYRGTPQMFDIRNLFNQNSAMQMTAGCGVVSLREAAKACGAAVHVVDSLLHPPKQSVMENMETDPNFSIFSKILKESSLAEDLAGEGPFTILAPSDHVFRTLPDAEMQSLLEDAELKDQLAQRHVLREHICCSGISSNAFPFQNTARTAHGSTVHLHHTPGGLLKAGPARITHCSKPLTNGLVHRVNSLYVEPHVPQRAPDTRRWGMEEPLIFRIPFLRPH